MRMTGAQADTAIRKLEPGDTVRIPGYAGEESADMVFTKVTQRRYLFAYADMPYHLGETTRKDLRQCLVAFGHI